MTLYTAVDGVEIPKATRTGGGPKGDRKYPFNTMEVGKSFFIPNREKNTLSTHASIMGKRLNKKFKTMLVWGHELEYEDGSVGWQLAHAPGEEGSVLGIGVWRMA